MAATSDSGEQSLTDVDGVFARLARESQGIQDIDGLLGARR